MISYLKGEIIGIFEKKITLLCGNVGYEIYLSENNIQKYSIDQKAEFYIFTRVREDEISLYGFSNKEELNMFKNLIATNGVGPKTAMEILSISIEKIEIAILQKNIAFLSKIPGLGKKTAEKICIDLQNKINKKDGSEMICLDENKYTEALEALIGLGYKKQEIHGFLSKKENIKETTEEIIAGFLKSK